MRAVTDGNRNGLLKKFKKNSKGHRGALLTQHRGALFVFSLSTPKHFQPSKQTVAKRFYPWKKNNSWPLNSRMSSTEFNIGLADNRSSSRVLRPPVSWGRFARFSRSEKSDSCWRKSITRKSAEKKKILCGRWSNFARFRVSTTFHDVSIPSSNYCRVRLGWRLDQHFRPSWRSASSRSPQVRPAEQLESQLLHEHRRPQLEGPTAVRRRSSFGSSTGTRRRARPARCQRRRRHETQRQCPSRGRPAKRRIAPVPSPPFNGFMVMSQPLNQTTRTKTAFDTRQQLLLHQTTNKQTKFISFLSESELK